MRYYSASQARFPFSRLRSLSAQRFDYFSFEILLGWTVFQKYLSVQAKLCRINESFYVDKESTTQTHLLRTYSCLEHLSPPNITTRRPLSHVITTLGVKSISIHDIRNRLLLVFTVIKYPVIFKPFNACD